MTEQGTRVFIPSYDLHNHTFYCGHAHQTATVGNLVSTANEQQLEHFGISEHVIFAEHAGRIQQIRTDLSQISLDDLETKIFIGVEMDPDPVRPDGRWVAEIADVDFVILSPHRIPEYNIGHWQFRELGTTAQERERLGEIWLDWYQACVEYGGFQILGHPFREPMNLKLLSLKSNRTFSRAIDILKLALQKGIAFEINNGWISSLEQIGESEPYTELIKELKEAGMKFSRGSDSHHPNHIGAFDNIRSQAVSAQLTSDDWLNPASFTAL